MTLRFTWDPAKARINWAKHGILFSLATTVFQDPLARTLADPDHGDGEDRWITLGYAANAQLLVVVHTWSEIAGQYAYVRIISARPATRAEQRRYEEELQ